MVIYVSCAKTQMMTENNKCNKCNKTLCLRSEIIIRPHCDLWRLLQKVQSTNKVMDIASGWIYYRESKFTIVLYQRASGVSADWEQVALTLLWQPQTIKKVSERGGAPIKQSFEHLSALVAQPEKPNASMHTRSAPSTMCLLMGIHNVSDQAGRGPCETSSNLAGKKHEKEYNDSFQL